MFTINSRIVSSQHADVCTSPQAATVSELSCRTRLLSPPCIHPYYPPVKAHAQKEIVLINEQERSFSIHSVCDVWVTFSRCLKCARVTSNSYFAKFAASVSRVKYLKSYLRV